MVKKVEQLWRREGYIPSSNCDMKPGQSQKQETLPLQVTSMVKRSVGHQHLGQVTRGQHAVDQITRGQHSVTPCLAQHRLSHIRCGIPGFQQLTRGQYILRSSPAVSRHHNAVPRCRLPHHNYLGDSLQQEEQDRVMLVNHVAGTISILFSV